MYLASNRYIHGRLEFKTLCLHFSSNHCIHWCLGVCIILYPFLFQLVAWSLKPSVCNFLPTLETTDACTIYVSPVDTFCCILNKCLVKCMNARRLLKTVYYLKVFELSSYTKQIYHAWQLNDHIRKTFFLIPFQMIAHSHTLFLVLLQMFYKFQALLFGDVPRLTCGYASDI